jgi:hypothetical protein
MIRIVAVTAACVVAFSLAGCSSGSAAPIHSTTAHPTAVTTPDRPTLASLVLGPDGLAGVDIGKPVPTSTRIATFDPTACVSAVFGVKVGDSDAGAWSADYPRSGDSSDGVDSDVEPFDLIVVPQTAVANVAMIWVWTPSIRTAAGIHVGSTANSVLSAYPQPSAVEHGPLSDLYVVNGTVGKLLIEVARTPSATSGEPADYWSSANNTVLWMISEEPDMQAEPVAGTDNILERCLTENTE